MKFFTIRMLFMIVIGVMGRVETVTGVVARGNSSHA